MTSPAGRKLLAALLAQLVKAVLRRQPDRRPTHQRLGTRLQLLQLLTQRHALLLSIGDAVGQRRDARFQLLMQRFQIVDIVAFTLAFAELGQLTLSVLLLAQALFKLVEAAAQPLRLLGLGGAGSRRRAAIRALRPEASLRASGPLIAATNW